MITPSYLGRPSSPPYLYSMAFRRASIGTHPYPDSLADFRWPLSSTQQIGSMLHLIWCYPVAMAQGVYAAMVGENHKFQVLYSMATRRTTAMMRHFITFKRAAKMLLHNDTVFQTILPDIRTPYIDITRPTDLPSAFPIGGVPSTGAYSLCHTFLLNEMRTAYSAFI